jgi:hypothetical protein
MDTFHEDVFMLVKIYRLILFTVGNVLDISCAETQNTHFTTNNVFPKIVPFTIT